MITFYCLLVTLLGLFPQIRLVRLLSYMGLLVITGLRFDVISYICLICKKIILDKFTEMRNTYKQQNIHNHVRSKIILDQLVKIKLIIDFLIYMSLFVRLDDLSQIVIRYDITYSGRFMN